MVPNNQKIRELSVFFPAFNEEKNISSTVEKARVVLEDLKTTYEILIINDGSTDNTASIADDLAKKYSKVKVIHQKNGGYGMALRSGFENANYDWIVYTDGDGQFDFAEVIKFLKITDSNDLIIGFRIKRRDPFVRLVLAKGWAILLLIFFGLRLRDVDCGFKMVKKEVIKKISPLESTRGGMINAELAIKASKNGFKIAQVGVNHYPRLYGKPTGAGMKVIINSFLELLKLRLQTI